MDLDLKTLVLKEVWAHTVPRTGTGEAQVLSKKPSKYPDSTRDRILSNIRTSLSRHRLSLAFDDRENAVMHGLVTNLLLKRENLKNTSLQIARNLFDVQPGNSSAGTLLVARAECNGRLALVISKVEYELRVMQAATGEDEELSIDLSEIETLSIDPRKLFKAAVFVLADENEDDPTLEIIASDNQSSGKGELADFWLSKFLECVRTDEPGAVFEKTVDVIMNHINRSKNSSAMSVMMTSIAADIEDQSTTFSVDAYMEKAVPIEQRASLLADLKNAGVTATEMDKHVGDLANSKYIVFDLSNGVRIIGPKETVTKIMDAAEKADVGDEDELAQFVLEGNIIKVGFRTRY